MTVTTGGRGTRFSSASGGSSAASCAVSARAGSTTWTDTPNSSATVSMASSVSDWLIVTISPKPTSVRTTSAGVRSMAAAKSWTVMPRGTTMAPGASGTAGVGAGSETSTGSGISMGSAASDAVSSGALSAGAGAGATSGGTTGAGAAP